MREDSVNNFFGMYVRTGQLPSRVIDQLYLWSFSISRFHPNAVVWLLTMESNVPRQTLNHSWLHVVYVDSTFQCISHYAPQLRLHWKDYLKNMRYFSDIVRVVLLSTWGGSWIDIDDIVIRPCLYSRNEILVKELREGICPSKLRICKEFRSIRVHTDELGFESYPLYVQNDPMLFWEAGHPFLMEWLAKIGSTTDMHDWGQRIPTLLLNTTPWWSRQHGVFMRKHHQRLLHPAYAEDYKHNLGPMFPPHEVAAPHDCPFFHSWMSKTQFKLCMEDILSLQDSCLVKNQGLQGLVQSSKRLNRRWLIGWIADCADIQNPLLSVT